MTNKQEVLIEKIKTALGESVSAIVYDTKGNCVSLLRAFISYAGIGTNTNIFYDLDRKSWAIKFSNSAGHSSVIEILAEEPEYIVLHAYISHRAGQIVPTYPTKYFLTASEVEKLRENMFEKGYAVYNQTGPYNYYRYEGQSLTDRVQIFPLKDINTDFQAAKSTIL